MRTFDLLKFLISRFSQDEKSEIEKEFKADTYYQKIYNDVQKMTYDEFVSANKGNNTSRVFNDNADYF